MRRILVALTSAVAAVLVSLLVAGAAAATSTTLVDQNNDYGGTQIISDGSIGRQAADDFVVPSGVTWTIGEVDASGEICLPSSSVTVQIYDDASGVPGTLLQSQVVTTSDGLVQGGGDGCDFTIPVSFTALDAGHYWLSLVASNMWYWSAQWDYPLHGYLPAFVSPYELGDSAWHPITALIGWWSYDLMFALQGTSTASDTTAPAITIATPVDGATYLLNESVTADYGCTDSESGVAGCVGTIADGAAIDTSTVGSHSFTVDASDNAGNTASMTVHYTVGYKLSEFTAPPSRSVWKLNSMVPIKATLTDASGTPIPDAIAATVNVTVSASGAYVFSALPMKYDAETHQFVYNWKVPKVGPTGSVTLTISAPYTSIDEVITIAAK